MNPRSLDDHLGAPTPGALPGSVPRRGPTGGAAPGAHPMARPPASGARAKLDAVQAHLDRREWAEAGKLLKGLLAKGRPSGEALFYAARLHESLRQPDRAREYAERSMRVEPSPYAALLLARLSRMTGDTDHALAMCDRALKQAPDFNAALVVKAGALEEAGRFAEAREIIEPMLERAKERGEEPPATILVEWAKLLVQEKSYPEAIETIDHVLADGSLPDSHKCVMLHLKAKACDRARDYPAAHTAAKGGNAIGELEFHPDIYAGQVEILIENWSREAMEKFPISSCRSEVPIFVAGMPRSGTSLIDQIIDAHPRAAGVGELATIDGFARQLAKVWDPDLEPPECFGRFNSRKWTQTAEKYVREIQKLAPGAERIVNKSLGNNRLVGLIARLFPNTRIIHAIRDPRDVAISCFMGGFNNALHPWTTRIEWVSAAWEQSMRMMDHWKAALDVPILDVHYENLVRSPETEFPRIIEFLGLEWDEACNDFHKSKRTVRTLSYDQVNRPVYTSSAGRHANYAEFIESIDFPEYAPPAIA